MHISRAVLAVALAATTASALPTCNNGSQYSQNGNKGANRAQDQPQPATGLNRAVPMGPNGLPVSQGGDDTQKQRYETGDGMKTKPNGRAVIDPDFVAGQMKMVDGDGASAPGYKQPLGKGLYDKQQPEGGLLNQASRQPTDPLSFGDKIREIVGSLGGHSTPQNGMPQNSMRWDSQNPYQGPQSQETGKIQAITNPGNQPQQQQQQGKGAQTWKRELAPGFQPPNGEIVPNAQQPGQSQQQPDSLTRYQGPQGQQGQQGQQQQQPGQMRVVTGGLAGSQRGVPENNNQPRHVQAVGQPLEQGQGKTWGYQEAEQLPRSHTAVRSLTGNGGVMPGWPGQPQQQPADVRSASGQHGGDQSQQRQPQQQQQASLKTVGYQGENFDPLVTQPGRNVFLDSPISSGGGGSGQPNPIIVVTQHSLRPDRDDARDQPDDVNPPRPLRNTAPGPQSTRPQDGQLPPILTVRSGASGNPQQQQQQQGQQGQQLQLDRAEPEQRREKEEEGQGKQGEGDQDTNARYYGHGSTNEDGLLFYPPGEHDKVNNPDKQRGQTGGEDVRSVMKGCFELAEVKQGGDYQMLRDCLKGIDEEFIPKIH